VAFKPETVLRVKPVVRPLFFTGWANEAAMVCDEIVPISRMAPSDRTMPGMTAATAQSTLLPGSAFFLTNVATSWPLAALQLISMRAG
jgi:hypothetical protein